MLTAVLDSFWGYDYRLLDEAGVCQGRIKINLMHESGSVLVGQTALEIKRDGMIGPWHARANGKVVATIIKPSIVSREFRFKANSREYRLQPRTLSASFDLFVEDECIGSLEIGWFFRRKMAVNLPDDLPLIVRSIAAWIVILMLRRHSQSG